MSFLLYYWSHLGKESLSFPFKKSILYSGSSIASNIFQEKNLLLVFGDSMWFTTHSLIYISDLFMVSQDIF